MTYILGVDPGGETGLCSVLLPPDEPAVVEWTIEVLGGLAGFLEAWRLPGWPTTVVCEAFHLDGRTPKPDLQAVQIIGALHGLQKFDPTNDFTLVTKTNTQGKHLMTDAVLKRAGYYPKRGKVGKGHGVDSMRHALNYAVSNLRHQPTQLKLFPKEED